MTAPLAYDSSPLVDVQPFNGPCGDSPWSPTRRRDAPGRIALPSLEPADPELARHDRQRGQNAITGAQLSGREAADDRDEAARNRGRDRLRRRTSGYISDEGSMSRAARRRRREPRSPDEYSDDDDGDDGRRGAPASVRAPPPSPASASRGSRRLSCQCQPDASDDGSIGAGGRLRSRVVVPDCVHEGRRGSKGSRRRGDSRRNRRRARGSRGGDVSSSADDTEAGVVHSSRSRRHRIKPRTFDGSGSFETFWAHFDNCSVYNRWNEADKLAHLKASLVGDAGQALWDSDASSTDTLEKLTALLRSRFGGDRQADKYRMELRLRRRRPGESLSALHQDIRRLMALAHPTLQKEAREAIACDYFVDALDDPKFALKIRERAPPTLDEALRVALQLEAWCKEAQRARNEETLRLKPKVRVAANDEVAGFAERLDSLEADINRRFNQIMKLQQASMSKHEAVAPRVPIASVAETGGAAQDSEGIKLQQHVATKGEAKASWPSKQGSRRQLAVCWRCGQQGHLQRNCGFPAPMEPDKKLPSAVNRGSRGLDQANVYIRVQLAGKPLPCLLDSGCEVTLIPKPVIEAANVEILPSGQRLWAANGTEIEIVGKVTVPLLLNGRCIMTTALVSPDIEEVMLGSDWLKAHNCLWDFGRGRLYIDGRAAVMLSRKRPLCCRRVFVQQDYMLPPRQQVDVPARSTLLSPRKVGADWIVDSHQVSPGIYVGRTLLPASHHDLKVHMVNTTAEPQLLTSGMCLGSLQPVDVVEEPTPVPAPGSGSLGAGSGSGYSAPGSGSLRANPGPGSLGSLGAGSGSGFLAAGFPAPGSGSYASATGSEVPCIDSQVPAPGSLGCGTGATRLPAPGYWLRALTIGAPASALAAAAATEIDATAVDVMAALMDKLPDDLTADQREQVRQLLLKYDEIFSRGAFDMGCTSLVEHSIDTGDQRPIRQSLRRHPMARLDTIDRQVDELIQDDLVEPAASPWASNVVLVRKKDGSYRLCVDYRALNEVTYKDSYPLPHIDTCLGSMNGAVWFSTLDLRSGYHAIPIKEADRDKTAFITRRGCFRYKVLPFGLTTAPSVFQRLMDLVLCGLTYLTCLVYIDDIIVFSRDFDDHVQRLQEVFDRLRGANLKLHVKKCCLFQRKVAFLGHVLSEAGIEVQDDKVAAVRNWPTPRNLSELRSFLGLCSYYRRFVPNFADVAAPLHALQRKQVDFVWTEKQEIAFNRLKERLITSPVLGMPTDEGTYQLDCDASDVGLGAVLSQKQGASEVVIAYASRALSKPECNYDVTRRELLAIVFGLKTYKQYLLGRRFVIRTDHAALLWLRKTPEPMPQLARWLVFIEQFDFDVQHRPGHRHGNADSLSRKPVATDEIEPRACGAFGDEPAEEPADTVNAVETLAGEHLDLPDELIADFQLLDPEIGPIARLRLQQTEKPSDVQMQAESETSKMLHSQWDLLEVVGGVLYRRWSGKQGKPDVLQLLVPVNLRQDFMLRTHTGMCGGHLGLRRTLDQIQRRAFWRGWRRDVQRFCRQCPNCSSYFRGQLPRTGPLQPMLSGAPFERLHIDVTGPHPRSRRGSVYILTCVDPFTKWAEAFAVPNKEATTLARVVVEQVICRLGTPLSIVTDRARELDGELMREICRLLDVDKLRTTTYKASTNAAAERFHRTLNSMIGRMIEQSHKDWDLLLPFVMAAYRSSRHEATQYTPNYLMLGREVRAPIDVVYGFPEASLPSTYDNYADELQQRMLRAYTLVSDSLLEAAKRAKRYYDR